MFKRAVEMLRAGNAPILYTAIDGPDFGKSALRCGDEILGERALAFDVPSNVLPSVVGDTFVEQIATSPRLILCGAGHVSVYTAKIAKMIGFRVTVIDDRTEFASSVRFPDADQILTLPFEEALNATNDPNSYYVIVTRGHKDDLLCLKAILTKSFAYCGMIGSRSKIGIVFDMLRSQGISDELLSRVHSPIGLKIGAQTPEEIALSIVGEMIQTKNASGHCSEWDESLIRAVESATEPYAMVTLIDKHGSAPRSAGARMIVKCDGSIISSVGGGFGEYEASEYAKEMLMHGPNVKRYTCKMNNTEAASKGMICGGEIDILIQIVEV